jgi:hypothetical protein
MTASAGQPAMSPRQPEPVVVTAWLGWVLFAAIILFVSGLFNAIEGLVALLRPDYYRTHATGLAVQAGYGAWGWVLLITGIVLALAGYGIAVGQTWARVVGIIVAVANTLVNFAFIGAYPLWITLTVTLNVLVVYALAVHGREVRAFR